MKKEFTIKSRGLFSPKDDKPFKVSRSGIELFVECPCCLNLNNVEGIRRPNRKLNILHFKNLFGK